MDIQRGVQVDNLLYASLIRSDKPDSVIAQMEKQPEEWQFKIVKAGANKIIWQSGKEKAGHKPPKSPKTPAPKKPEPEPKPKKAKPKPENEITVLPAELEFIKPYCGRAGNVKTKTQVYIFIKKLQKDIAEKKIRKTSEYAPQIVYITKPSDCVLQQHEKRHENV